MKRRGVMNEPVGSASRKSLPPRYAPSFRFALRAGVLMAMAMLGQAFAQPADWPSPYDMTFEPVEFEAPRAQRAQLSNGMTVYLAEDHSLPLIQGVAYVDAPAVLDPEGKTGLAAFTAAMLREGGAGERTPDEVDATLEFLAASVEAGSDQTMASVSFSSLSSTIDQVLPIWSDTLQHPGFDPARIEVQRQRQLEAILRVRDNPVQLAVQEFYARVTQGHPVGASPDDASIQSLTRDDLVRFHDDFYGPGDTVIAVTGDFDSDTMLRALEASIGTWDNALAPRPEVPPLDPNPAPKVYFAQKQVEQSVIIVGQPSVRAYTPDSNAFTVANFVLGAGGFSSRMFTDIRTKRGLAYATGSQLSQGFDFPGIFLAYAFTRGDATGQVLDLMLGEIRNLVDGGITEDELEQSRETILNQSLFRATSVQAITERTARVQLLGLEPDYYETFLSDLQSLTTEEVDAATRRALHPDGLVIMVVGDEALFDRPLSDFGEVERIELE